MLNAWAVQTETGYTFPVRFTPRLALRADVASGGQHPNGGSLNTFNPLFPRGAYFGPLTLTSYRDSAPLILARLLSNLNDGRRHRGRRLHRRESRRPHAQ
jgi:Alginate export